MSCSKKDATAYQTLLTRYNGSLVVSFKSITKEHFRTTAMLFFHIIQKKSLTKTIYFLIPTAVYTLKTLYQLAAMSLRPHIFLAPPYSNCWLHAILCFNVSILQRTYQISFKSAYFERRPQMEVSRGLHVHAAVLQKKDALYWRVDGHINRTVLSDCHPAYYN
jgi:hypothetical protein